MLHLNIPPPLRTFSRLYLYVALFDHMMDIQLDII
jgi:hypothetical protein